MSKTAMASLCQKKIDVQFSALFVTSLVYVKKKKKTERESEISEENFNE